MRGSEGRTHFVEAWSRGATVFESYRYAPGPASEAARHSHEEYQLCLSLDFPGEYRYRGERHAVPVGSLSVIHPGEVHSSRDPHDRETPATYRLLYVGPSVMREVASELTERARGLPSFPDPVFSDGDLAREFLSLHLASEGPTTRLEEDARLLDLLARLVTRRADVRSLPDPPGRERRAVRLAKEYLEDNFAANVPLEHLARVVGLSPFHLARVFGREIGLPPHAYQTQARVRRARDLLLDGWPVARVAHETGFADQSHLSRHFKRLVGVPPGSYARPGDAPGGSATRKQQERSRPRGTVHPYSVPDRTTQRRPA
jgi:AraC-like DNA-binding protein